jgi:hypothetical protein
MKKIITLFIIAISFSSCFNNYFKVKTDTEWKEDHLKLLKESDKRIVVHFRNAMKLLANPVFETEEVSGKLETYNAMDHRYVDPNTEKKQNFKYKYRYRKTLFAEIHLYVNDDFNGQTEYKVNAGNFAKSNIYSPNKGLSIASHALGITIILSILAAIGVASVAVGTVAVLNAVAMNCPQTYVEVGPGQYQFIGGLFTGAVDQNLQRSDMITLPMLSTSDTVRIQIKGMQNETQYLDLAELKQVAHPVGTEIVGNRLGDMFVIRHLKMPKEIRSGQMIDRSKNLLFRDGQSYGFHITDSSDQAHIELKFSRKETDKKALLVARLKNSEWGGYITDELRKSIAYPASTQPGYRSLMINSSLKVSVLTKHGWKAVDYFPPAGNTAIRDLAMEVDLSDIEGKDVIIRMESPYRFWDLDQVGLSYELTRANNISNACRISARVEGKDYSASIDQKDGMYLSLGSTDQLELTFTKGQREDAASITMTYVLVAAGYYQQAPLFNTLQASAPRFSEPSGLNRYSIAKYKELGFNY